jgi:hypothetical protein
VLVHNASCGNSLAGQQQWRPGLDDIQRAVLTNVSAVLREEMAGRVQDCDVGAAGRIREQGEDAHRGIGIGVVPRAGRARHDALTVIGKERHRVLARYGVQPHQDLVTSVLVKPHTPDMAGGHRHLTGI